ncbi:chloride channel protein [Alginatibacterium sediminis]|uniref:Chloride channel protein n=1 Tax=Alginatibacterium sediminis TaxID=2164068 RepID=A0A420EE09_9ALTE|nr:chloride channel protein [Alginatibacterium sediminis]RKF18872.1 chloride channel protein [Alginatibacterium sediminis]
MPTIEPLNFKVIGVACVIGISVSLLTLLFSEIAHLRLIDWNYSPWLAILLPSVGALTVYYCEKRFSQYRQVGFAQAITSYHFNFGLIGWQNIVYQFVLGLVVLICGFAVGVVGPSCYLAAGLASYLARFSKCSSSHVRTAIACGIAAAIAALFNAPLAASIFALELVTRHYDWRAAILVWLSAGIASFVSNFHNGSMLHIPLAEQNIALSDYPYFLLLGLAAGCVGTLMIKIILGFKIKNRPISLIVIVAITALAGLYNPEFLGLESITPSALLEWDASTPEAVIWLLARILLTGVTLALFLPAGSIGPMIVIGGLVGVSLSQLFSGSPDAAMICIGMAALLAAVFATPVAAALLLFEHVQQPQILLPTLVACVIANACARKIFKTKGLFASQLEQSGVDLKQSPVLQINLVDQLKASFNRV